MGYGAFRYRRDAKTRACFTHVYRLAQSVNPMWISFVCFKLSTMGVLVITTHKRPCVEMSPVWVGAKPFIIIFLYKHNYMIFFKELL
jgi:hypothetical protein